jgi:septal ring factor EnvC (AmiA/AmiB activator)
MTSGPPDKPRLEGAQDQLAFIRRERDRLARQIEQSQNTLARSQALIARLDALLAKLERKQ